MVTVFNQVVFSRSCRGLEEIWNEHYIREDIKMKLELLEEKIWRIHEESVFSKAIFRKNKYMLSGFNSNKYEYGHFIYLDYEKPEIISGVINTKGELFDTENLEIFCSYLKHF